MVLTVGLFRSTIIIAAAEQVFVPRYFSLRAQFATAQVAYLA